MVVGELWCPQLQLVFFNYFILWCTASSSNWPNFSTRSRVPRAFFSHSMNRAEVKGKVEDFERGQMLVQMLAVVHVGIDWRLKKSTSCWQFFSCRQDSRMVAFSPARLRGWLPVARNAIFHIPLILSFHGFVLVGKLGDDFISRSAKCSSFTMFQMETLWDVSRNKYVPFKRARVMSIYYI